MIIIIKIISIYLYIIIVIIIIIIIINKSIYFKIILIYKYIYKIKLLGFNTYDLAFVQKIPNRFFLLQSAQELILVQMKYSWVQNRFSKENNMK